VNVEIFTAKTQRAQKTPAKKPFLDLGFFAFPLRLRGGVLLLAA